MNWNKIQEKYPKPFKKWQAYYLDPDYKIEHALKVMNATHINNYWGWLLEFFDSKGIYIIIYPLSNSRSGNCPDLFFGEWGYSIKKRGKDKTIYDVADNPIEIWYKSRQEAQEAAVEKTFEVLHDSHL